MTSPLAIPFVVGQWVRGERFYGRSAQIAELLEGPRNSVWLLGTRRMGKTSLLKQLEFLTSEDPESGYFPLFWDFQGASDPEELHLDFSDALLDAEERLEAIDLTADEIETDDLFKSLSRLRRLLRARGLRLLLLCDEVEELIELNKKDPALLRKLRRAMQSSDDVRSVLSSTIRLWALADERGDTSPFLHGFAPPVYLQPLTNDEARDLIRQANLEGSARPAIAEDDIETIREKCDNHPYLMQLVCKRHLETGDLEEAIDQVATDDMVSYFFSVDFEMLSDSERNILRTVARRSAAGSQSLEERYSEDASAVTRGLRRLANLGFVRREPDRKYVLANYFFRRWLTALPARPVETPDEPDGARTRLQPTSPSEVIDNRYQLLELAGEGATGLVYMAFDRLLKTKVAIKLLKPEFSRQGEVLERFRQETLLSRDLGHPNVLRVYDLGEWRDGFYLTMQWIEGPTLGRLLADEPTLPLERTLEISVRLASALEAAHGRGVLHRDIKPQNILLRDGVEPLITDFGLARLVGEPGITGTGMFLGTPNYVSPEQANMRPLDKRSDIYSLGVVIYEMATGRRPFVAQGLAEILEQHRKEPPPDPLSLVPELPDELCALLLRCLEKEPEARPQSAAELRLELERLQKL